jgi:hypothetical protein
VMLRDGAVLPSQNCRKDRVFESRVLKIFGSKRDEVRGE